MRILDLAGAVSTDNIALINSANLFISIDEDLDLTNGIQISKGIHTLFNDINVTLDDEHFNDIINVKLKQIDRTLLRDQNNVQRLIAIYYPAFECQPNTLKNTKIGQSAQFTTLHHRLWACRNTK